VGSVISFIIELVVVVLLGFTVTYCVILDRRLQRLRADETAMRRTVVDLGLATERADRAIDGLRQLLAECDRALGDRLRAAADASAGLDDAVRSGDEVLDRIGRIVAAAKRAVAQAQGDDAEREAPPAAAQEAAPAVNVSETVAAANAFAERARRRIMDAAA
jgi:hypothetical protein